LTITFKTNKKMEKFKTILASEIKKGQAFYVSKNEKSKFVLEKRQKKGNLLCVEDEFGQERGRCLPTFDENGNEYSYYILNQ
jgi:hypothetical protein